MRVLCIGKSVIETTCVINERIEEGKTIRIDNKTECGGGLAGNVAYLLGKWGVETYIASMLGPDDGASKIKKEYETIGIKTDYLETSYDKKTGQSIVIVNETTKNKTVLDLESNSFLKKYSFGIEPDIVISDGNDFNATVAAFDKYEKIPTYLIVSRFDKEMLELCKYANILFFSQSAAESATNIKFDFNNTATLVSIYNSIKQKYNKSEVIITIGERGCIYSIGGQVKILPPVRVGIVDTNGAKEAFVGGYAYGVLKKFDLEKCLIYGTIAASIATTKLTSRNSLPSLSDVSNYYDSKFGGQNSTSVPNDTTPLNSQTPATPSGNANVGNQPVNSHQLNNGAINNQNGNINQNAGVQNIQNMPNNGGVVNNNQVASNVVNNQNSNVVNQNVNK